MVHPRRQNSSCSTLETLSLQMLLDDEIDTGRGGTVSIFCGVFLSEVRIGMVCEQIPQRVSLNQKPNRKVCLARLEVSLETRMPCKGSLLRSRRSGKRLRPTDGVSNETHPRGSIQFSCASSKGNCLSEVSSGKPILFLPMWHCDSDSRLRCLLGLQTAPCPFRGVWCLVWERGGSFERRKG